MGHRPLEASHDVTRRKRVEDDLREEQERFQAVFENASVGIALIDPEGHVVAANDADFRFLGYSNDELTGMHFTKFTHAEEHSMVCFPSR